MSSKRWEEEEKAATQKESLRKCGHHPELCLAEAAPTFFSLFRCFLLACLILFWLMAKIGLNDALKIQQSIPLNGTWPLASHIPFPFEVGVSFASTTTTALVSQHHDILAERLGHAGSPHPLEHQASIQGTEALPGQLIVRHANAGVFNHELPGGSKLRSHSTFEQKRL